MKLNKIIVAQMAIKYLLVFALLSTTLGVFLNYYSLLRSKEMLLKNNSHYVALASKQQNELQPLIKWWQSGIKNKNSDYINLQGSSLLEEKDILPPTNAPSFCKYSARKYVVSYGALFEFINNIAALPNDLYIVSIDVAKNDNSLVLTLQFGVCKF
jgi:hypothetical protein